MKALSVISSFSQEASSPVSRSTASISSARSSCASCRLDTLTHMIDGRFGAEPPLPVRHLPARFGQDQPSDLPNHAGVFGDGNEFDRARSARARMAPARQRLEAADAPGRQRDDRLVAAPRTPGGRSRGADRFPSAGATPRARASPDRRARRASRLGFRAMERDRRILQRVLRPGIAGRADGDPDGGGHEHLMAVDVERLPQRRSQPLGHAASASLASAMSSSRTVNSSPPRRASVNPRLRASRSGPARTGSPAAGGRRRPAGDRRSAAEAVVHGLEAIEAEDRGAQTARPGAAASARSRGRAGRRTGAGSAARSAHRRPWRR